MGHRIALSRALEKLEIPYILWSEKPVLNKLKADKIILGEFPVSKELAVEQISVTLDITHVIAAVEKAVIPGSNIRLWFKLKRNPHSLILKCTDKFKMKSYLFEKNIPMTEFCSGRKLSQEEIIEKVGWPVISKPRLSSGGRGIMFLNSKEEMIQNKSSQCYYEKAISGTEGSIESFIHNNTIIFSNITEYFKNGYCNKIPGRYSEEIIRKIEELNSNVLEALNIKWGMTHLEYYITDSGLYFGEVALRPPGGYIMDALSMAYDIDSWELFLKVELNLIDNCEVSQRSFSSTVLIHPGEGVVKKIEGVEDVKSLKSVQKFKLNIKVGDTIGKREGVGQNYGHAFFCNESSVELDKDLNKFYSKLKIHLA